MDGPKFVIPTFWGHVTIETIQASAVKDPLGLHHDKQTTMYLQFSMLKFFIILMDVI